MWNDNEYVLFSILVLMSGAVALAGGLAMLFSLIRTKGNIKLLKLRVEAVEMNYFVGIVLAVAISAVAIVMGWRFKPVYLISWPFLTVYAIGAVFGIVRALVEVIMTVDDKKDDEIAPSPGAQQLPETEA